MPSRTDHPADAALHSAIERDSASGIESAIAMGANLNGRSYATDLTPVQLCARRGNVRLLHLLLEQGARLDSPMTSQPRLLEFALSEPMSCQAPFVEAVIAAGGDVHRPRRDGRTPLHMAVTLGDVEVVNVLLRHGADPNAVDADGQTPLHLAVSGYGANHDTVFQLVKHGADIDARDHEGLRPLDLTARAGQIAAMRFRMLFVLGADTTGVEAQIRHAEWETILRTGPLASAMVFDEMTGAQTVLMESLQRHAAREGFEQEIQRALATAQAAGTREQAELLRSFLARHKATCFLDEALQSPTCVRI